MRKRGGGMNKIAVLLLMMSGSPMPMPPMDETPPDQHEDRRIAGVKKAAEKRARKAEIALKTGRFRKSEKEEGK
jgi:hypothetical protein